MATGSRIPIGTRQIKSLRNPVATFLPLLYSHPSECRIHRFSGRAYITHTELRTINEHQTIPVSDCRDRSVDDCALGGGVANATTVLNTQQHSDTIDFDAPLTKEEDLFIARTAAELKEIDETGTLVTGDGTVESVDLDELLDELERAEALDTGSSPGLTGLQTVPQPGTTPSGMVTTYKWSWSRFGNCVAKGLGVNAGKELIKVFAEPKVRKALKSKQWKKSSSIAFNLLKKSSPKIAKFIIKKAANALLPGGLITFFAFPIAKCAVKELIH
ncbi:MAG: hypothetical protein ACTII7_06180 [Galactobacter sp.]